VYMNVCSTIIHNNQEVKIQMSIICWMDKQNMFSHTVPIIWQ
jgi:hypothetical protein